MKEYIVKFIDDKELDRFERIYGTEEEIVRCCDCKYWEEHHKWVRPEGGSYIAPKCNHLSKNRRSDWFCADGERKESK